MGEIQKLYSLPAAAKAADTSVDTLRRMCRAGTLKRVVLRGRPLVPHSELVRITTPQSQPEPQK
jgi:hypothetical protein